MNLLPNEYTFLFNTITETEEALDRLRTELMHAQRHAEELFIAREAEHTEARSGGNGT